MRPIVLLATAIALLCGIAVDADSRPRRPKKQVEYYQFPAGYIDEKVEPYIGTHDRVIVANELVTMVTEGSPICRLTWEGRRVDALLGTKAPIETIIRIPRNATIDEVKVYLVDANGSDGEEVEKPILGIVGDSLVVTVEDPGDARVLDVHYTFTGEGISVDESFLFQPELPVLKAEYKFSVSRELWQEAADKGLTWEFSATAEPRTWEPARDDTPDFFSWYWRDYSIEPLEEGSRATPRSIAVTGYLPAPVLAGYDPEALPDVNDLENILDFTASLVNDFRDGAQREDYGGGSGSLRDRYEGGDVDVPIPSGGGKSVP